MQAFLAGLQAAVHGVDATKDKDRMASSDAQVRAAVVGQQQLVRMMDRSQVAAMGVMHAHITRHNLEQDWGAVQQAHKNMLVSRLACVCAHVRTSVPA